MHKERAKRKSWEDQNHLCGSGDGPRKKAKRAPIKGLEKSQIEFVLPDQPRDVIEEEALRTRTLHERSLDGRQAAMETATEQLVAAAPPQRQEQVARAAVRVQEHADAQVAATAAAPTVEHQGRRVDAGEVLKRMLQLEEENRQLHQRTAYLAQMPPISAERLAMNGRMQAAMRAQTGFGSYRTFLRFMDQFRVYFPQGVRQYRGLESIPNDVLEAAINENAKRGTAAPGATLPWWEGEEGAASADGSSVASSGDEDAPRTGRVGSGVCAGEEEGEEGE